MKQMKKAMLMLALCASTQAFGWKIVFDPASTYSEKFEILTFEKKSDYKGMLEQAAIGGKVNDAVLKVAPIAGKVAGGAKKAIPDPDFKVAMTAITVSSGLLVKILGAGGFMKPFTHLTKEGYTVDFVKEFKPSATNSQKCRDKASLKDHVIHKIKKNQPLYFVIYDKKAGQVRYADWGPAYGEFKFSIVTMESEETHQKQKVGVLEQVSETGGTYCK